MEIGKRTQRIRSVSTKPGLVFAAFCFPAEGREVKYRKILKYLDLFQICKYL